MNVDYFFNDFAHQVVGNIYRMFLEHIVTNISDRFQAKIMATYQKAVEALRNENPELSPNVRLPAICVDPTTPLQLEEKSNSLWRVPIASVLSKRLFEPIYQDENIRITPGFVRYESQVSVYMWFDSIYEKIDTEMRFLQAFHSLNRWSKPYGMEVLCPLPDRVYTYDNPDGILINWQPNVVPVLLETIDKQIPMFPMYLAPMVKMTSLSDISTKDKDSGDEIGNYRLQADFQFEFEVPTFYLVDTHWQIRSLKCTMATTDSITNLVYEKDVTMIDNPNEPTDPDKGILVPQTVIPQDVSGSFVKVVKYFIWYMNQENIMELPPDTPDFSNYFIFKSGGIVIDPSLYHYSEDTNSFIFQGIPEGTMLYIILIE